MQQTVSKNNYSTIGHTSVPIVSVNRQEKTAQIQEKTFRTTTMEAKWMMDIIFP
jgi:hypothetical protein